MSQNLPPLGALRAFEATARLGSVTAAAEELSVTHGAVSRQLRSLDEFFATALFAKAGRGIRLTPAGEEFQRGVGEAFALLRDSCAELRRHTEDAPLVVHCPGSLLARWFIPRLERLQREVPNVTLQVASSDSELDPETASAGATLMYTDAPLPAGFHTTELASEEICVVTSPQLAADCDSQRADSLFDVPLLYTRSRPQAWPQWGRAQGLDADRMQQALARGQGFDHLYYLIEAALAGLGVAIAPRLLVQDDLKTGRLVAPWGATVTAGQLVLVLPNYAVSRRSERLTQWLQRELGEGRVG